MKNTNAKATESDTKDIREKKLTNESLLLPCVAGNKISTSASIAEKSNVWAENKLCERKVTLDQKLHKSIVKLNVDMLEVAEELTKLNRMKKSASTGALDTLHHTHNSHNLHPRNGQDLKDKWSTPASPKNERQMKTSMHHSKDSHATSNSSNGHKTVDKTNGYLLKPSENKNKIAIKIGSGSSSDEMSDDEKSVLKSKKTIVSVLACQNGRQCSSRRSAQHTFENTTRRFKHSKACSQSKLGK